MQFLRRNWVGLLFCALGVMILTAVPIMRGREQAYRSARPCPPSARDYGCRFERPATVTGVTVHHESHGSVSREVSFRAENDHYDSYFSGDRLAPGVVREGQIVSVEVWHDKVTAMTVAAVTYRSFYVQPTPWEALVLGPLLIAIGLLQTGTGGLRKGRRRTPKVIEVPSTPGVVSIRPAWGGPHLHKRACLTLRRGVLEAVDPRGHTHSFDLSDAQGPYALRYGDGWKGGANLALVDKSGAAVLLVDSTAFRNHDIDRLETALALPVDEAATRPPTRRGTVRLVNLPYFTWAVSTFTIASVTFFLWRVTDIEFLVLGVTLPALVVAVSMLFFARRSMMTQEDLQAELKEVQPKIDQALAFADDYLAKHGDPAAPPPGAAPQSTPPQTP